MWGAPIAAPIAGPAIAKVTIRGPLAQRAHYYAEDACAEGYVDGYDAVTSRMLAAMADADVLVEIDGPGGDLCGLPECVDRIIATKAETGRKVTVVVNGMAGSAHYWLACSLADPGELYITRSSQAGSIGARGGHVDESGALAMEGHVVTEVSDPPGKIALTPMAPLSDLGRARIARDIGAGAELFRTVVGAARGLDRKALLKLDGDMLTGAAAVAAGLVDAVVASVEEVEAWALARAEGTGMEDEGKPGEGKAGGDPPPEEKAAVHCTACGGVLTPAAKFCAGCGTAIAAATEEEDEEEPTSSKPAARVPQGSTVAAMLGLRPGASDVAVKTALADKLGFVAHVIKALGASDEGTARGKLKATIEDARQGVAAAKQVRKLTADAEKRERLDLCLALAKAGLPEFPRGNCVVDLVNDDGKVVGMEPGALFKHMPIAELRGFVAGKIEHAGPSAPIERSPFEPSEAKAKGGASATVTDHDRQIAARTNSTAEQVAATRAALDANRRTNGAHHGVSR